MRFNHCRINEMKKDNLKSLSLDELWELHESLVVELTHRIARERGVLEDRLQKLGSVVPAVVKRERRPYPRVLQKIVTKPGRDAASHRGGCPLSFVPENSSRIF